MPSLSPAVTRRLALAAVLLYPFLVLGTLAGDAEIHLVFGEHAAAGHLYAFNTGELSAGETSPGWMLYLATLFRLLPAAAVPIALKISCFAIWFAVVLLTLRLARRVLPEPAALLVALLAGLIPGSVYNAVSGMENGLFGLLVLAFLDRALATDWFDGASPHNAWPTETLLAVAAWVRPEALVVAALAFLARLVTSRNRPVSQLIHAATVLGACLLPFAFLHAVTSHWLPTSALARIDAGRRMSLDVGPFRLRPDVPLRLLAYLPITLAAILGLTRAVRDRALPRRPFWLFLGAVVTTFVLLHATVLGVAHVARYLLFAMPLLVLLAALGLRDRFVSLPVRILGSAWLLGVFVLETHDRLALGSATEVLRASAAVATRTAHTDALLATLGPTAQRPVVIALHEVQERLWLDDRVVVRTLDGRTDARLLDFAHDGALDLSGYLRAREVTFLLDGPHPGAPWVAALQALVPAASLTHDGLVFTRLASHRPAWRLEPAKLPDPPPNPL